MTRRLILATTVACGLALAGLAAGASADERGFGPGRGMGHRGGRGHWFHPVIALVLIAALALTVWFVARRRPAPAASSAPSAPSPTANAESILAERLARGEISPDDYRAAIAVLRPQATAGAPT